MAGPTVTAPTATYPLRVAHTIEYFEKGIDEQGPYYKVQYLIDNWSDTDFFVNFLLGYVSYSGPAGANANIVKHTPHQHPLSPNLFCRSARVVAGLGGPSLNTNGFPNHLGGALIQAEYRPMTPYPVQMTPNEVAQQIDPGTPLLYCTQELEFGTETILLPGTKMTWSAGPSMGKPIGYPFKKQVGITLMVLTFHRVPYMPASVIRAKRGKTNLYTFLGASAGTVYFEGARVTRDWDTSGQVTQKLVLTFKERESDWNNLIDPTDMQWHNVAGPMGVNAYTQSDFSTLLSF